MRTAIFAMATLMIGNAAIAQQSCNHSFWVWQGGERVKVCCNQQNFCVTKFGIYSQ